MNSEKICAALKEIEAEVRPQEARVLIRHMVGGGSITWIKATRSGLLRLGVELIRAGTKDVPESDAFRSLLARSDDDILIEIKERVDDVKPDPKMNRQQSLAGILQFVWVAFLFGFAALGVAAVIYYLCR